jgi:ADP-ribose pyrophosphatase YjhB (NUDIX family)
MDYKISAGIAESDLPAWLKSAAIKYGTFKDGRVNYKAADIAPTVMCTVACGPEILLVKRGYGLADAEGYWSTVNGFIDEAKPLKNQVKQELKEELGLIVGDDVIQVRESYTLEGRKEKRSYIVFPCLVSLKSKPAITLNRENTEYLWIKRNQLESFDILDDLPYAVDVALGTKV